MAGKPPPPISKGRKPLTAAHVELIRLLAAVAVEREAQHYDKPEELDVAEHQSLSVGE